MTKFSDRLKQARREAGYASASDAARAHGWNVNTYKSNEYGVRPPGRDVLLQYAQAYRVSVDWLLTGRGAMRSRRAAFRQVPIYKWEAFAGTKPRLRALLAAAEVQGYIAVAESDDLPARVFTSEAPDDSAVDPKGSRLSVFQGDIVLIDPDHPRRPGCIVLAFDGRQAVLRQMWVLTVTDDGEPDRVRLVALNPVYPSLEVPSENILGVMIRSDRRFSW